MSSIKSFRAKIQDDFSDSDVENFDDCDSKRSTISNCGQSDKDLFGTTLDSTFLKASNVETVCFEEGCSKRILELEHKFDSMEKYIKESVPNVK